MHFCASVRVSWERVFVFPGGGLRARGMVCASLLTCVRIVLARFALESAVLMFFSDHVRFWFDFEIVDA